MTSIWGADLDGTTELSRRLAVFPAVAGALAVFGLLVGSQLAGVMDAEAGQLMTVVAALLIAVAMGAGFVVGHYLGLSLFAIAVPLEPRTSGQLALVLVTLIVVHELGRFSLDARRPTRFAPGYVRAFFLRSGLIAALVILVGLSAVPVADFDLPPVLVPVGLALAALPLFVRRMVQALGETLRNSASARLAVGLFLAVLALGASLVGAQARSGLVNERATENRTNQADPAETSPDETEGDRSEPTLEENVVERVVSFTVLILGILIAGLLYAAFRRPEIGFELDDLNLDVDHRSLGLANPGEADLDDLSAAIDERDMAGLLDNLLLDISSEPDPGRAIRYGYATVEQRLAELGVERRESETEQELLTRALPALPTARSSLIRLTTLFESARFGVEPMTESLRAEAITAVETLRGSIADDVSSGPSDQGGRA